MGILNGKVIIVTGATSGIGEATAIEAAQEGAKVVVAGRREERGQSVVTQIKQNGGSALFISTDVTIEEDIKNLVKHTVAEFGRLDGAFNNAGIVDELALLEAVSTEDYDLMMNVNLRSIFWSMKYEIPEMKKKGGAIVNCASISGTVAPLPTHSTYVTAKHGIVGLSKAAAIDYAQESIRVNAVLPGSIETEIWDKFPETKLKLQA